ncbi:type II toxin-antitoxin system VapC family toxin [Acidianus manzaensis]|uniref:Toxin VapC n=1 Tax=Acidianus manzaensis TaxID=282676 RepID=A0A1W6JYV9_9CREN|nr:type II toxin-antitoxin system VapC family toxin [Acidianus manzaensis]ARM75425.1 toxin VapC [Acidianus manzaensis]
MSYVIDSSSIYKAIIEKKANVLGGNYTISLAKFELGNIIWKEVFLRKKILQNEGISLLNLIVNILDTMCFKQVNIIEAEKLAILKGITFYDASYLWLAKELNIPLVSEDEKLKNKIDGEIETLSLDNIL